MKYKITNKKTKESQVVDARKKPQPDLELFRVERVREKEAIVTSNQKKRALRETRVALEKWEVVE